MDSQLNINQNNSGLVGFPHNKNLLYYQNKIHITMEVFKMNNTITNGRNTFELVDFIPYGYKIWNIGKNMIEGYLPLVITGGYDGCQVVGTMKAVKCKDAQVILSAIGAGQGNIKEMEIYIKENEKSIDKWAVMHVARLKKALEVMYTIDGVKNLR